jgi:hypothetical protein
MANERIRDGRGGSGGSGHSADTLSRSRAERKRFVNIKVPKSSSTHHERAKYAEIVLKTSGTRAPAHTRLHLPIIKEKYAEIVLRSFGTRAPAHAALSAQTAKTHSGFSPHASAPRGAPTRSLTGGLLPTRAARTSQSCGRVTTAGPARTGPSSSSSAALLQGNARGETHVGLPRRRLIA